VQAEQTPTNTRAEGKRTLRDGDSRPAPVVNPYLLDPQTPAQLWAVWSTLLSSPQMEVSRLFDPRLTWIPGVKGERLVTRNDRWAFDPGPSPEAPSRPLLIYDQVPSYKRVLYFPRAGLRWLGSLLHDSAHESQPVVARLCTGKYPRLEF